MTASVTTLPSPQRLYRDWEGAHWSAHAIDLAQDRADWTAVAGLERGLLQFALASLMVAEERISTQFCGLVLAQDDEEEGSYLATQLVDEVRHMQFYARFQDEVVADPASIAAHVARARELMQEPLRLIFDEALVRAHARLVAAPRDRQAKVDFVTIYHLVIEGTLGVTTSHFLLGFLRQRGLFPGFVDGYSRIASDEGRHIAYGTGFLQRAVATDGAMAEVVRNRLDALMPAIRQALSPAGAPEILGLPPDALTRHGLGALEKRLAAIGIGQPHAA
jgi:ribonucleoside-diphosphate reductase beta chain